MHIGQKIKRLVSENKTFNTKSFALSIGHTEQSMHAIYKKESIQVDLLLKICERLNISLSDFLEESEKVGIVSEPLAPYGKKLTYKLIDVETMEIDNKNGIISILLKK